MTAEQAKKQFDSLKDFKERFLFWEENKALIQQSFIDELKLLSDRELERSMERIKQQGRGAVYHTRNEEEQRDFSRICEINSFIESIEPLPKEEEEKAFVAQFKINEHQKYLEADKDSIIYSFDTYKREYWEKLNKMTLKDEFIHDELKRIDDYLKSCKALVGEVVIDSIRSKANEGYKVDYKKWYENCEDSITHFYKLALIISPTQYSIFLENEKRNLGTTTQTVASETRTIDKGFDYSNEPIKAPLKQTIESKKKVHGSTMNKYDNYLKYALYCLDLINGEGLKKQQAKARTAKDLYISLKTVNRALATHSSLFQKDK
jgi:hypothetical protein